MRKIYDHIFIYVLIDPRTNLVRYVGKSVNPQRRLYGHMSNSTRGKNHLGHWLSQLKNEQLKPNLKMVEKISFELGSDREKYWIEHYSKLGFKLCNSTLGGEGCEGFKHTSESIEKMMKSRWTPEKRAEASIKMSETRSKYPHPLLGKSPSVKTRKKISDSLKGKPLTEETKRKISEGLLKHYRK